MNNFTIIGIDDKDHPELPEQARAAIATHHVFSGGKRHHEIMRDNLPEAHLWIDITVPLDEVFRQYENHPDIVVFASGDPLFFGFANTVLKRLPDAKITLIPTFNSLQTLAHRLLLPYHDMHVVSLTGRPWHEFDRALIEGQEKIGVEGTVTISAVHASDLPGKPLVVTHHEAPFSQTLELSGESGDLLDARVTVRDVAVASQDAGDGGKTLRAEVLLGVQGTADTQEKLTVLRDAYTYQGAALTFSGRDVVIRTGQRRASAAESGKTTLLLPDGTPPVRGMLAAFATPIMTAQDSTGSRLNTEGMLEITLLYMTDENTAPVTVHQETPFRTSFAVSAAPDSIITLTADEVEATPITSDRVELRYVLRLTCDGVETQSAHLLTDAQEEAADEVDDGLYLCYCQTGEDWWTLAKEYRVPQEKLRRLNPDLPDALKAGTGVVVWKKSP